MFDKHDLRDQKILFCQRNVWCGMDGMHSCSAVFWACSQCLFPQFITMELPDVFTLVKMFYFIIERMCLEIPK